MWSCIMNWLEYIHDSKVLGNEAMPSLPILHAVRLNNAHQYWFISFSSESVPSQRVCHKPHHHSWHEQEQLPVTEQATETHHDVYCLNTIWLCQCSVEKPVCIVIVRDSITCKDQGYINRYCSDVKLRIKKNSITQACEIFIYKKIKCFSGCCT